MTIFHKRDKLDLPICPKDDLCSSLTTGGANFCQDPCSFATLTLIASDSSEGTLSVAKLSGTAPAGPLQTVLGKLSCLQAMMEGISLSQPQPKVPSELIKFVGKRFNAWHICIPLLESHSHLFPTVTLDARSPIHSL